MTTPAPTPARPASAEALGTWLAGRRWFASGHTGSAEPSVTRHLVPLTTDPDLAVGLVDTSDGDRYQLLVPGTDGALGEAAGRPDVADVPAAAAALARFVAEGSTGGPAGDGAVSGHWLPGATPLGADAARAIGGEQSNTSVVVGGTHVLKLFRRLRAGAHPEIEIGRHLAAAADDGLPVPVARLAGWYQLDAPAEAADDAATALGVVQELVPGALDAWTLVLSGLAGDPGGLLTRLHDLGRSLARLHDALARSADAGAAGVDTEKAAKGSGKGKGKAKPGKAALAAAEAPEAFGAVPFGRARLAALVEAIAIDAGTVLATAVDRPPALASVVGRAGDVGALAATLAARLGDDVGAAIRHHGDLHLGQVVLGPDGWVVLDFEGEPSRPLAERRLRHSPLRDVAGMLRSFAYAAATHRRAEGDRLSPGWEPAARAAFLDGYLATVDPALLPASAADTRTLLALLELEKVVYEVGYELAHRPDWVDLPVHGLLRLLDAPPA